MQKDTQIIISRFNEPVEWLYPFSDITVLYNKGENDIDIPHIKLKNIGMEHHTWVYHIVNNYENLPKFSIFLQGNPFPHYYGNIDVFLDKFLDQEKRKYLNFPDINFIPLTDWFCTEYIKGERSTIKDLHSTYIKLFGREPDFERFEFSTCGQFCVSSDRIKKHPKKFYLKLLKMFEDKDCINKKTGYNKSVEFAYTIERMWSFIFSK